MDEEEDRLEHYWTFGLLFLLGCVQLGWVLFAVYAAQGRN